MYKGNISKAQKQLNIVIKYKKAKKGTVNAYVTPTGLMTDQRIYREISKKSLLAYIKKEGNTFQSKKKIKDNEAVKHLIISPIQPQEYNKLNEEEKEKLKDVVIKQLFKDFAGYGFIGGIEQKNREIEGKEYYHFHIHIAVSAKYDIKPQNIDYLKRSITKAIVAEKSLKNAIGLQTKNELISKSKEKNTKIWEERKRIWQELAKDFEELKNINKYITIAKEKAEEKKAEKDVYKETFRNYLRNVQKNKKTIRQDIKQTAEVLKEKNQKIKEIQKDFKEVFKSFKEQKDVLQEQLSTELKGLQQLLQDDLKYFVNVLNWEHNIYVKYLQKKLKNKEITEEEFILKVASNRNYIEQKKREKKEQIKQQIQQKHIEIKKRLEELQLTLKYKLKDLKHREEWELWQQKWNSKRLEHLQKKLEKINKKQKNEFEKYMERMKIYIQEISTRYEKFGKYINIKKEKLKEIQLKKLKEYKLKQQLQHKKQKTIKKQANKSIKNTKKNTYKKMGM